MHSVTREFRPHVRMHSCPSTFGMSFSMIPEGTKAKIVAHEREDYVGKEVVQLGDHGKPIMSVTTERDDGQDVTVYAPTAVARGDA
jgi:hypothetical protein